MAQLIMVVDDDPGLRQILALLLERSGYQVFCAESGEHALEQLETSTPDLFLLDVMMPGMTGIELCAAIRRRPALAYIPIVMLSALRDRDTVDSCQRAGATDYLTKPVIKHQLLFRIESIFSGASSLADEAHDTGSHP